MEPDSSFGPISKCPVAEKELIQKLTELFHRLDKLEIQAQQTKVMHDSIKSVATVVSLIERFCIFMVKLGAVIGGTYAAYKLVVMDIAGRIK